ncbi:hypothetical protein [Promicromonospora iranensis]|uniref:Uncharacterized protein n=1 Tax=Promicromonospora iranensis TaxID=1105144 RepID=A0ABU2CNL8_9MICO|nr:hypothetical protein [Promicromonospora iranensis]MDR7382918.1 hypothetical protein [Promicromonospora iranensis]
MSATRRKGSRGGRAASRAGGPPASNALTWAESLAAGEAAPSASALEWAESLKEDEPAPSPWGSGAAVDAPAEPSPADETTGSPWGPVPTPAVADGESDGDANPWGAVAAAEPPVTRGRGKNAGGKSGRAGKAGRSRSKGKAAKPGTKGAPKSEPAPTPAGGFPLNVGPVAEPLSSGPAVEDDLAADPLPDEAASAPLPDEAPPARPAKPGSRKSGKQSSKGPRRRIAGPSTAQQKRIKRTLRRGLPRLLDKPVVLVLAGVIAAVLGLGTGWGMTLLQDDEVLSSADAASCAQTQMAWTQAANAQSAMVEDQPETLRKGFINARNALEGVTPPEAIAEDWAIAFTYYSTVANNIEKVKPNDGPAVSDAVGGAQRELDTDAMVEASQRVQEFVASNCRG